MGGDGQLVVVLLGSTLGGASTESCTLLVETAFGGVLGDVLNVGPDGVLNGVPPFSSVLLGF